MKTLRWHYAGVVQAGAHDLRSRRGGAEAYTLEKDYVPKEVRLRLDAASAVDRTVIDINDDGESIFLDFRDSVRSYNFNPQIDKDANAKTSTHFLDLGRKVMKKGSVVTMDVDKVGQGAKALTVELDLVEYQDK